MIDVIVLVSLGLILGVVIGLVVKFYGVEPDETVEKLEELLPGANCGMCGFAGCTELARAMAKGQAEATSCPSVSSETLKLICEMLGVTAADREPMVAIVRCSGGREKAGEITQYNGINDCVDAVQVAGGPKACQYGCLGFASCARACPYNAIELTEDFLAVVHPERCVGCGKCVETCPRNLIELVPKAVKIHVFCNSPEKGATKRKVCSAACIGCRKCAKEAGDGITMDKFLARVNYENPPDESIADVCPTKCLRANSDASEVNNA